MSKKIAFYNADEGDVARSILAGCYKFGSATLLRKTGATMTSVIEIYDDDNDLQQTKPLAGGDAM